MTPSDFGDRYDRRLAATFREMRKAIENLGTSDPDKITEILVKRWNGLAPTLAADLARVHLSAGKYGRDRMFAMLRAHRFQLPPSEQFQDLTAPWAASRARWIQQSTERRIVSTMKTAKARGFPPEQVVAMLNGGLLFGTARQGRIAATESTFGYNKQAIHVLDAAPEHPMAQWRTGNDEKVCEICAPLGGVEFVDDTAEPVSLDEQWANGQKGDVVNGTAFFVHPGGSGAAGAHAGEIYEIPPAHDN